MKKFIYPLLLVPSIILADNFKKFSVGLTLGSSIPTGDFADKEEGGADTGVNFGFKGAYRFSKNMSLGFSFNSQAFEYSDDFEKKVINSLPEGASVDLEKWNFTTFLLSPRYSHFINEQLNIFGEAHLGFAFCNSPEIIGKYEGQEVFKQTSAETSTFTFGIGAGIDYFITENLDIDFSLGLFPVIEPEYEFEDEDGVKTKSKLKQTNTKLNLGISYNF